jgi:hypothetical protein
MCEVLPAQGLRLTYSRPDFQESEWRHSAGPVYIAEIEAVKSRPDPNPARSAEHEPLLSQIEGALKFWTAMP